MSVNNTNAEAQDLVDFVSTSPTAWHAAETSTLRLVQSGFVELNVNQAWNVSLGEMIFVRHEGTVFAFVLGNQDPTVAGIRWVGAHTDSPHLRLKPKGAFSKVKHNGASLVQLAVEPYGGVLLHTWFDRDLSLAGRVHIKENAMDQENDSPLGIRSIEVNIKESVARIPTLAIHLNRSVNTEGFAPNPQEHLSPVFTLGGDETFLEMLETHAGVSPGSILGFDLSLYDAQPPALIGKDKEWVSAPRLDNLACSHAALSALIGSSKSNAPFTRAVVLYDHEECGSKSERGAASPMLRRVTEKLLSSFASGNSALVGSEAFHQTMSKSVFVSADMAHALHPNYREKHEPQHLPFMGGGPVIKSNANLSYGTDGKSSSWFASMCKNAGIEPQYFVTRSDIACGSTIGPITAALHGVPVVDVGNPMWSMHSCREMASSTDVPKMIAVLRQCFLG